jgi:hypothetical protein
MNLSIKQIYRAISQSASPRICEDIRLKAAEYSWQSIEVASPILDYVRSHLESDSYSQQDFRSHIADYSKPQTLVQIPGAKVRDDIGLVFLSDGSVCAEGHWWTPFLLKNPAYSARFRKKRKIAGDVYSLLGTWSEQYYHWFHDILPGLQGCLKHLPPGIRFLVHSSPKEYQLTSCFVETK